MFRSASRDDWILQATQKKKQSTVFLGSCISGFPPRLRRQAVEWSNQSFRAFQRRCQCCRTIDNHQVLKPWIRRFTTSASRMRRRHFLNCSSRFSAGALRPTESTNCPRWRHRRCRCRRPWTQQRQHQSKTRRHISCRVNYPTLVRCLPFHLCCRRKTTSHLLSAMTWLRHQRCRRHLHLRLRLPRLRYLPRQSVGFANR